MGTSRFAGGHFEPLGLMATRPTDHIPIRPALRCLRENAVHKKQPQRRSTVGTTEQADRTQRRRRSRRASSLRARRLLVVLAGHSPTGLIAARYAPAHRYRVAGLVLMDPTLSTVIADTTASIPESATRRAAELRAQSLTVYGGENPEKLTVQDGKVCSAEGHPGESDPVRGSTTSPPSPSTTSFAEGSSPLLHRSALSNDSWITWSR